jgi:hypothetical protein
VEFSALVDRQTVFFLLPGLPVMHAIGIGILPNDCDTLAFIGQGHSSMQTQTHARSSSSCDGIVLIIEQQQTHV